MDKHKHFDNRRNFTGKKYLQLTVAYSRTFHKNAKFIGVKYKPSESILEVVDGNELPS